MLTLFTSSLSERNANDKHLEDRGKGFTGLEQLFPELSCLLNIWEERFDFAPFTYYSVARRLLDEGFMQYGLSLTFWWFWNGDGIVAHCVSKILNFAVAVVV